MNHAQIKPDWAKANEAFYLWERDSFKGESGLSDDDRAVWVHGYLQALRDAHTTTEEPEDDDHDYGDYHPYGDPQI